METLQYYKSQVLFAVGLPGCLPLDNYTPWAIFSLSFGETTVGVTLASLNLTFVSFEGKKRFSLSQSKLGGFIIATQRIKHNYWGFFSSG